MNWNKTIRQWHRWLSIAFTLGVLVNTVAAMRGTYTAWIGALALVPLLLQLASGLYLFALPYVGRARRTARPS